jgi:hypothetical protein
VCYMADVAVGLRAHYNQCCPLALSAALLSCEPDVSREQHYQVLLREHMACAWSPSMITLLDAEGEHITTRLCNACLCKCHTMACMQERRYELI